MKSGAVTLDLLVKHVCKKDDPLDESLLGKSALGRKYGKIAKDITASIADQQGFYLWGKYEKKGLRRNIYLGKAGYGKTARLRKRILEELKDEKVFLWSGRSKFSDVKLLAKGKKLYPNMWMRYKNQWKRALLKAGTSHIIWVATPELHDSKVQDIESDLIETLNPSANLKRPTPPSILQSFTKNVIGCFRHEIHINRILTYKHRRREHTRAVA